MICSFSPGLIMTCSTVGEFDELFLIVTSLFFVAVQAPAHVHDLRVFGDLDLAHVAVAVLAVEPGGDVGTVVEMHEFGYFGNRHPDKILPICHGIEQGFQFYARVGLGDLLVTAPTLVDRRQPGRSALGRAGMAVQTRIPNPTCRLCGNWIGWGFGTC